MSLTNLGLTPSPLVHTIFRGFPLHSEDSVAGVFASGIFTPIGVESNSFQYFCAQIEVWYLPSKFQIQFYIFLRYSLILRPRRLQPLRFVLQYDPSRSNGWHLATFWLWLWASRYQRLYSVHQQYRTHESLNVVPWNLQDLVRGSPHSAHIDLCWNCQRVYHWILEWERVARLDYWRNFHQWQRPIHQKSRNVMNRIAIYWQSQGSRGHHRVGKHWFNKYQWYLGSFHPHQSLYLAVESCLFPSCSKPCPRQFLAPPITGSPVAPTQIPYWWARLAVYLRQSSVPPEALKQRYIRETSWSSGYSIFFDE